MYCRATVCDYATIRLMGSNNHFTADVGDESDNQRPDFEESGAEIVASDEYLARAKEVWDEWRVEIVREANGSRYELPGYVRADTESCAMADAEDLVARVLDGVGASFKRDGDYRVEITRIIE